MNAQLEASDGTGVLRENAVGKEGSLWDTYFPVDARHADAGVRSQPL